MSGFSKPGDWKAGKTEAGFLLADTIWDRDEESEETLDAGVFMVFKMAPSGLTNNFLTDVSKWNTEVLSGSGRLLGQMAGTKDVLAKRVAGGDLITEVSDTVGAGGGTENLAVFTICGVVCTVGRELVFPREFTIFVFKSK